MAIAIGALTVAMPVLADDPVPLVVEEMSDAEWDLLEAQINTRANEIANSRQFFEKDRGVITVKTRLDRVSHVLTFELDATFVDDVGDLPLEDLQSYIGTGIEDLTARISDFTTTLWMVGGHSMDYWFNQQVPGSVSTVSQVEPIAADSLMTYFSAVNTAPAKVVVAAGHGAYFHQKYKWTMQRDRVNGVLEDEITQDFAKELAHFIERRGAEAIRLRGAATGVPHEPSGLPWESIAARYFIENWRPESPELWNTKPESIDPQRERFQDIRSRPLYANDIGADAVIHIHTNASTPGATGARVFVHPGRPEDFKLAQLALCGMSESIHSDPRYADYYIPRDPSSQGGKGENFLAKVPSMIVEVGFHTNVDDAKALQDPVFQKLSMKGVAKGLRLFKEGASCAPFAVKPIEPVTIVVGEEAWVPVPMTGNPTYIVNLDLKQTKCDGFKCRPRYGSFYNKREADAYRFRFTCIPGDELEPIDYIVQARDADGIRTPPVTYRINCVQRPA
jgi:N-acetylmuramoyl-L-alanine amidase